MDHAVEISLLKLKLRKLQESCKFSGWSTHDNVQFNLFTAEVERLKAKQVLARQLATQKWLAAELLIWGSMLIMLLLVWFIYYVVAMLNA